jgi:hypothetical protein
MLTLDWYCLGLLACFTSCLWIEIGVQRAQQTCSFPPSSKAGAPHLILGPCLFCHSPSHVFQDHVRYTQAELASREVGPTWGEDWL